VNGKSLCSFSGRDVLDADEGPFNGPDDDVTSRRNYVQSYGVFVSLGMKDSSPSAGFLCRALTTDESAVDDLVGMSVVVCMFDSWNSSR
jgi:hypothetical protein